ncbi:MAG: addiction module protein [Candidatus Limnocylindrales bacterium]
MTIEEIKREALRLDPERRAELAHALLSSLDSLSEAEIERLWADEAARRDAELDSGTASSSPAEDVLSRARSRRA